jgi:hypothetical protein
MYLHEPSYGHRLSNLLRLDLIFYYFDRNLLKELIDAVGYENVHYAAFSLT